VTEEQIKIESENFTEIFEVPLQNRMRAFWYLVGINGSGEYVTIMAPNATEANKALEQQFHGCVHHFLGKCELIMQVNTGTHLQEV
jgi:hypothetical protein